MFASVMTETAQYGLVHEVAKTRCGPGAVLHLCHRVVVELVHDVPGDPPLEARHSVATLQPRTADPRHHHPTETRPSAQGPLCVLNRRANGSRGHHHRGNGSRPQALDRTIGNSSIRSRPRAVGAFSGWARSHFPSYPIRVDSLVGRRRSQSSGALFQKIGMERATVRSGKSVTGLSVATSPGQLQRFGRQGLADQSHRQCAQSSVNSLSPLADKRPLSGPGVDGPRGTSQCRERRSQLVALSNGSTTFGRRARSSFTLLRQVERRVVEFRGQ